MKNTDVEIGSKKTLITAVVRSFLLISIFRVESTEKVNYSAKMVSDTLLYVKLYIFFLQKSPVEVFDEVHIVKKVFNKLLNNINNRKYKA